MKQPIAHLLTSRPCQSSQPPFFLYFAPLECNTQDKIYARTKKDNKDRNLEGETLFWEAYDTSKQDESAFERIVTFHQMYNFSRNMSFASFLAAAGVLFQLRCKPRSSETNIPVAFGLPAWLQNRGWQFLAFLFVGFILFLRYLYFYRAHTIKILTSYAYGP